MRIDFWANPVLHSGWHSDPEGSSPLTQVAVEQVPILPLVGIALEHKSHGSAEHWDGVKVPPPTSEVEHILHAF